MSDLKSKKKVNKLIKLVPQLISDLNEIKNDEKLLEHVRVDFNIDYLLGSISCIHSDIKRVKKSS